MSSTHMVLQPRHDKSSNTMKKHLRAPRKRIKNVDSNAAPSSPSAVVKKSIKAAKAAKDSTTTDKDSSDSSTTTKKTSATVSSPSLTAVSTTTLLSSTITVQSLSASSLPASFTSSVLPTATSPTVMGSDNGQRASTINTSLNLTPYFALALVVAVLSLAVFRIRYRALSTYASTRHFYLQFASAVVVLVGAIWCLATRGLEDEGSQVWVVVLCGGLTFAIQSFLLFTLSAGTNSSSAPAAASVAAAVASHQATGISKRIALSLPHIILTAFFIPLSLLHNLSSFIWLPTLIFIALVVHFTLRVFAHAYLRRHALYPTPIKPFRNPLLYALLLAQILSVVFSIVLGVKRGTNPGTDHNGNGDAWILPIALQTIANFVAFEFLRASGVFIRGGAMQSSDDHVYRINVDKYRGTKPQPTSPYLADFKAPPMILTPSSPGSPSRLERNNATFDAEKHAAMLAGDQQELLDNFPPVPNAPGMYQNYQHAQSAYGDSKVSSIYGTLPNKFPSANASTRMSRVELPELAIVRERREKSKDKDPGRRKILGLSIGNGKKRDSEESWGDRLSRISWWGGPSAHEHGPGPH